LEVVKRSTRNQSEQPMSWENLELGRPANTSMSAVTYLRRVLQLCKAWPALSIYLLKHCKYSGIQGLTSVYGTWTFIAVLPLHNTICQKNISINKPLQTWQDHYSDRLTVKNRLNYHSGLVISLEFLFNIFFNSRYSQCECIITGIKLK